MDLVRATRPRAGAYLIMLARQRPIHRRARAVIPHLQAIKPYGNLSLLRDRHRKTPLLARERDGRCGECD